MKSIIFNKLFCLGVGIAWLFFGTKDHAVILSSIYLAAFWVISSIEDLKDKE